MCSFVTSVENASVDDFGLIFCLAKGILLPVRLADCRTSEHCDSWLGAINTGLP